jgi:tRNA(fMet)-specific endonuclease VapC
VAFLIDTDICSAHLKQDRQVASRFVQHLGQLHVSTITLGELFTWGLRSKAGPKRVQAVLDLLNDVTVLDYDAVVAREFGTVRAHLYDVGTPAPSVDLQIAATALVHGLTLVTHNTSDFVNVPGLRIVERLAP